MTRLAPVSARQAAATLDSPRDRARRSFAAWMAEAGRARAAVETAARAAVADCYRFGLTALDQPEAFDALCKRLDIRATRADRAGNPFIRVVKAVFGREVEDAAGGPPQWQPVTDSQVNKYATVLAHAQARGIPAEALEEWLSRDYTPAGETVAMSITRRLREARDSLGGQPLPPPSAPPSRDALHAALDRLAPQVDLAPLALRGLAAPQGMALILALGEDEAVRLGDLPEDLMLEILATIERHIRKRHAAAEAAAPAGAGPFRRLAGLLGQAPFLPAATAARLVHHRERLSVLAGAPGGPVLRVEWRAGGGDLPRHRVLALAPEALAALRAAARDDTAAEVFVAGNYPRPGGLLGHALRLGGAEVAVLEVPVGGVPPFTLGDVGAVAWDARAVLGRDGLVALARFDSRAAAWKRPHVTRTGRATVHRASRIAEAAYGPAAELALTLRRGPGEGVALPLRAWRGLPAGDRISRRDLGRAAGLLLRREAVDDAALTIAAGAVWLLSGRNPRTGEDLFIALPVVDATGKAVRRGVAAARFEADGQPFSDRLEQAVRAGR
ncbi:hypothetical protein ACM64Y_10875 [Novispirillum sp. DQ9]|uniref:hypothetical protein n=1 Tax=Novispirillum sp. DQ9 TaxID=3398612 RepID=UPI003C7C50CF